MFFLDDFELYLEVEKRSSIQTIENYMRDIRSFIEYENTPQELSEINTKTIRSYLAHLTRSGSAVSTVSRKISSLRGYFDFLKREGYIENSPMKEIKKPKAKKSLPKYLTNNDMEKLLETSKNLSIKTRLIVELLYGSGGRVTEVISLKVNDIDFEDSYIQILGKGDKERHNPIHEPCVELIKQYLNQKGITEGYIFPHRQDQSRHQTRESVFQIVKNVAKKAGVDPDKVSPHVFRHSFATHLMDNGCDISTVQEYLGHADSSTTRIYGQVTRKNKTDNYKKFHPLSQ